MVKLTPDQYTELRAAQEQLQAAQIHLNRTAMLLGLPLDTVYSVKIELEEVQLAPQAAEVPIS